jgi:DNA adenine methylase
VSRLPPTGLGRRGLTRRARRDVDPLPPPLKWAGGKRWQLPYLQRLWQSHSCRRLVEPFCGGLAIALGLQPAAALLNDINPHLINFYEWLKAGLVVDLDMVNDERVFYSHRTRFNELLTTGGARTREAAALFYYLNRTGYNGLCRFNRSGLFNVPFGRYARIAYVRDFASYAGALRGSTFTCGDIEEVALEPDDFVYADPPYDVEFTQYSRNRFTWSDQQRAAERLAAHAGPVVLVNQATPRIEQLYRQLGFEIRFLEAPRRISCTGDRTPAREIVATRHL